MLCVSSAHSDQLLLLLRRHSGTDPESHFRPSFYLLALTSHTSHPTAPEPCSCPGEMGTKDSYVMRNTDWIISNDSIWISWQLCGKKMKRWTLFDKMGCEGVNVLMFGFFMSERGWDVKYFWGSRMRGNGFLNLLQFLTTWRFMSFWKIHTHAQKNLSTLFELAWSLRADSSSQCGLERAVVGYIHAFTHECCQEQLAVLATDGFHWRTFVMLRSAWQSVLLLHILRFLYWEGRKWKKTIDSKIISWFLDLASFVCVIVTLVFHQGI